MATRWTTAKRRAYRRTKNGVIDRMIEYMSRRCRGKAPDSMHYAGLPLADFKAFRKTAFESQKLEQLYNDWVLSGYKMALRPTPDRIDPSRGYELHNIQFITYSENAIKGNIQRTYGFSAA